MRARIKRMGGQAGTDLRVWAAAHIRSEACLHVAECVAGDVEVQLKATHIARQMERLVRVDVLLLQPGVELLDQAARVEHEALDERAGQLVHEQSWIRGRILGQLVRAFAC